jgi:cyclomaltodextrinase / maltogenic alpha-amylase / neopullulanase
MRPTHFISGTILLMVVSAAVPLESQESRVEKQQASFVPRWVNDAIFYQIFPERFGNGDPSNDPPGTEPWGGKPKPKNYFGGDLQGIIDHLDYLSALGVNAIYLNPIFQSNSNHKYHADDYLKIDPAFGDEIVFRKLVDNCHARGLRVILDGVFNHSGTGLFAFKDIKENGAKSKYRGWYNVYSFPLGPTNKPNYECWWGYGDLPKLMTQNPDVRKYLFHVTEHWMKFGIDGWRLDVPNEVPHEFWIEWRKLVKSLNPEAYIVGEIWDDARPWLNGDQFDAVMNYKFREACLAFFVNKTTTPAGFDAMLASIRGKYQDDVNYAMQNLLGSHDTERLLTLCKGDKETMKLAWLFLMTYPGAPMIYYGDEIGMTGGKDPECRGTMIWDQKEQDADLLECMRGLIRLRNEHSELRTGRFESLVADSEKNAYAFIRTEGANASLVILNNSNRPQSVTIPNHESYVAKSWRLIWPEAEDNKSMGVLHRTMMVPAKSGLVFRGGK